MNLKDRSVPQLFDAVFGFLARTKPESFSTSGISLEHIVSQSLHKWRTILLEENLTRADTAVPSLIHKQPLPSATKPYDAEKAIVTNFTHFCSENIPLQEASGVLHDQIQLERAINDGSNVATEEIIETSNYSSGGDADHSQGVYTWSQTMEDVDIQVAVPPQIIKGKQLSVEIKDSSVHVALKSSGDAVLLHGTLRQSVDSTESLWDLAPGRHVTLHLCKRAARWWHDSAVVEVKGMLEGATEPERDFSSMPEDEQADIRRIVFDAEQKAAGQPTSDTLKMESLLRSAWDAPNSPFQGQEFDLSKVNVVPQGP
ncbi:CS domain [Trinorchestia longiramus]|nr:CS domain [Trinorchestia longiramus]